MKLPEPGPATRLVLVRHAEADDAYAGRCYGSRDLALSPAGRDHARELGERLSTLPVVAVFSSPRRRAMSTAAPIATSHGLAVSVEADLREMDFGSLEGRAYTEIERTMPALWEAWMARPTEVQFPGGESFEQVRQRSCRAVDAIRRANPSRTVVVVAHGGVLRALLAAALGLPSSNIFRLDQAYGAVNVIDWFDEMPVVRIING